MRDVLLLATALLLLLEVLYFDVVLVREELTELLRLKLFEEVLLKFLPE